MGESSDRTKVDTFTESQLPLRARGAYRLTADIPGALEQSLTLELKRILRVQPPDNRYEIPNGCPKFFAYDTQGVILPYVHG